MAWRREVAAKQASVHEVRARRELHREKEERALRRMNEEHQKRIEGLAARQAARAEKKAKEQATLDKQVEDKARGIHIR